MTQEILICYDGSSGAKSAIDAAAALFGPRHAIVLNVAPAMTFAEGTADALLRAGAGAARARRAGLDAEPRATLASTTWKGIVGVADELDVAAIVIGSRGRLSHDVSTHAGRPVLTVPPVTT